MCKSTFLNWSWAHGPGNYAQLNQTFMHDCVIAVMQILRCKPDGRQKCIEMLYIVLCVRGKTNSFKTMHALTWHLVSSLQTCWFSVLWLTLPSQAPLRWTPGYTKDSRGDLGGHGPSQSLRTNEVNEVKKRSEGTKWSSVALHSAALSCTMFFHFLGQAAWNRDVPGGADPFQILKQSVWSKAKRNHSPSLSSLEQDFRWSEGAAEGGPGLAVLEHLKENWTTCYCIYCVSTVNFQTTVFQHLQQSFFNSYKVN